MAKTKDKVSDAATTVKPYFDRALHDEDLRENARNATPSCRTTDVGYVPSRLGDRNWPVVDA